MHPFYPYFLYEERAKDSVRKAKNMTNADRIRAMTDKEMATDLLYMFEEICEDGVPGEDWMLMWLQKPVEE